MRSLPADYTMRFVLVGSLIVVSTAALAQAPKNIRCLSEHAVYVSADTPQPDEVRFRFGPNDNVPWAPPLQLVIHAPSMAFDLELIPYVTNSSGATGFFGTLAHDKLPEDERKRREESHAHYKADPDTYKQLHDDEEYTDQELKGLEISSAAVLSTTVFESVTFLRRENRRRS
jgi:hypothetical protein